MPQSIPVANVSTDPFFNWEGFVKVESEPVTATNAYATALRAEVNRPRRKKFRVPPMRNVQIASPVVSQQLGSAEELRTHHSQAVESYTPERIITIPDNYTINVGSGYTDWTATDSWFSSTATTTGTALRIDSYSSAITQWASMRMSDQTATTYADADNIRINVQYNAVTGNQQIYWVNGGTEEMGTVVYTDGTPNITWRAYSAEEARADKIKRAIRAQLSPEERRRHALLELAKTPEEAKARDTLRDMISEADWRRYLTNGFVMVKGASGKFYQVFNDQRHTVVYQGGQKVGSLCIHTDRECPPTDHIINLKLLIEFEEDAVWRGANYHKFNANNQINLGVQGYSQGTRPSGNLVELFKGSKVS